jgi:hypothetical protein
VQQDILETLWTARNFANSPNPRFFPSQTGTGNAPRVKVGPTVAAKANASAPSATAKNQSQKSSIGKGATSVKSPAPASFWTDQVDIDDDGTVEDNQFLWDAQRGVLYTYREDNFTCANGKPESGSILMAIYAKGNKAGKPVGSGWYVVGLNAGQCGIAKAGTYGCKFDASGNYTECGAAVVNEKTDELTTFLVPLDPGLVRRRL